MACNACRQSQDFDQGAAAAPCHGELLLAFSPEIIGGGQVDETAESLFAGFAEQRARLPGDRRYRMRAESEREGIAVSAALLERIRALMPTPPDTAPPA